MPSEDKTNLLVACTVEEDKNIFSLKDPGTSSRATVNVRPRKCQKIRVDGCLNEIQPVRCDWCVRDKSNGECLFVELKGSDCKHAAEQIINTIEWFRIHTAPFVLYPKAYIVAHGTIPQNKSKDQIAIARLASRVRINLISKRSPAQLIFEII